LFHSKFISTYDIRFYPVILGVLIDDPIILLPEIAIPLQKKKDD